MYIISIGALFERHKSGAGRRLGVLMKKYFILFFIVALPFACYAQSDGLSVGGAFGFLNDRLDFGKIGGDRDYYFAQISYFHEFGLFRNAFFHLEPFLVYINQPNDGVDAGLNLLLRYYLPTSRGSSLFFSLGSGGAYTSIGFKEQGTHFLLMLQGGIGFRWRNFFIEDRLRHYSNAGLAHPIVKSMPI